MLKFAYSPWEEESSKLSKWRNAIMGILALLLLTVSLGSIFVNTQSYAQTVSVVVTQYPYMAIRLRKEWMNRETLLINLKIVVLTM